ncbi:hypothetical protein CN984_19465 [Bacillus cereus]|uniref:Uncharacterized protein n=1 Tax=Bacillus cereus TaxID=1396 RepID=A0A2B9PSV6_BACCE|nr:hypothetical protein CN984_19465 [Bacillus cereus]
MNSSFQNKILFLCILLYYMMLISKSFLSKLDIIFNLNDLVKVENNGWIELPPLSLRLEVGVVQTKDTHTQVKINSYDIWHPFF